MVRESLVESSQGVPPNYHWIASALADDIREGRVEPGHRLPSERQLTQRFGVARTTVRSALELLRQQGLVVTGKRGTFANDVRPGGAGRNAAPSLPSPFLEPAGREPLSGHLFLATVPPALGAHLGLPPGRPTLHYRHHTHDPLAQWRRRAVTYFTLEAIVEVPQLARYLTRLPAADPDLAAFPAWCRQVGLEGSLSETVTISPAPPHLRTRAPQLAVRRWYHDQGERLLCMTDLTLPPAKSETTLVYGGAARYMSLWSEPTTTGVPAGDRLPSAEKGR
ncbi:GntR family transcriptional regulator [Streptomyces sp. cg28]|uniref:GntR family transcriptional regulator n=1 Tax=Streptomyces sp. cg28 TaxID=3403457 RepID=UPI003B22851C